MTPSLQALLLPRRGILIARIGISLWLLFNLIILVLVWRDPANHSVVGNYRAASAGWWAGRDIYGSGIDGFLYLPSFAFLYTPFWLLGDTGDVLWRALSAGTLTFAIWRAAKFYLPERVFEAFGVALLLALPVASAALRNGQATTLMVALMLLGSLAVAERRWWLAAVLLALAFAIKPLAIVLLLLAGALHQPMRGKLLVCTAISLLLPFLHPDPAAAWHVYGLGLDKLVASSEPSRQTWSDITGMLDHVGLTLPPLGLLVLRVAAALLTLWAGYLALRRQEGAIAALDLFALAVSYLMLMNPRTEENTYIALGVALALFAVMLLARHPSGWQGWLVVFFCIALGCHNFGNWIFRPTEYWLKPLVCLAFLPILLDACLGRLFQRAALSEDPADSSATPAGSSSP